ncbi:amino acid carrier protein, partial [candidate division KSB1 bacterium]
MEQIVEWTRYLAKNFWNTYTISLLLGTGLLLTILTKGIQFRKMGTALKLMMKGALRKDMSAEEPGDISPFQALTTALSATVGNGNIAGVATSIVLGGPGGPFWMWITALVGMATKYSEGMLGVKYRHIAEDGSMAGGPMYYIKDGFQEINYLKRLGAPLAGIFAVCGVWSALFGTANMMQSNSMALAFNSQFGIPFWLTGITITTLTGMVIIGGIKRIVAVAEKLVPFMVILYVGGALFILIINIEKIPSALLLIIKSAFTYQAPIGGFSGHAVMQSIRNGVNRGLLSNESGLGSAPIAHGAAKTKDPIRQGLIAMTGTFIDTIIVCSMTALVIIVTQSFTKIDPATGKTLTSTALTAEAFNSSIPYLGGFIISFGSFLFGLSTLIAWCYYGEQCLEYIFGIKITKYYRILFIILCFTGSILQGEKLNIVWDFGVVSLGVMAIPNLIGLIGLSNN